MASLTHSPILLAAAVVLHALPQVMVGIFGPHSLGGARSMGAIAAAGGLLLSVTAVGALSLPAGAPLIYILLLGALMGGWVNAVAVPLSQAALMQSLPADARVLGSRNYELSSRVPMLVAPILGGVAVGVGGIRPMFAASAALLLLTAVALRGWPSPEATTDGATRFHALRLSLSVLRRDSWLVTALSVRGLNNLVWPAISLGLPLLVVLNFRANAAAYGILLTSYAFGTLSSAALSARLRREHLRWLYFASWVVTGVGFIVVAAAPTLSEAIWGSVLAGVGGPFVHIALDTHIGTAVEPAAQAALFSFQRLLMSTLSVGGSFLIGWWLTRTSPADAIGGAGILVAAIGFAGGAATLLRGPREATS